MKLKVLFWVCFCITTTVPLVSSNPIGSAWMLIAFWAGTSTLHGWRWSLARANAFGLAVLLSWDPPARCEIGLLVAFLALKIEVPFQYLIFHAEGGDLTLYSNNEKWEEIVDEMQKQGYDVSRIRGMTVLEGGQQGE